MPFLVIFWYEDDKDLSNQMQINTSILLIVETKYRTTVHKTKRKNIEKDF